MILAFVNSSAATGSIRKVAGLRKLKELLAEMGTRDMLVTDGISLSRDAGANHVQQ